MDKSECLPVVSSIGAVRQTRRHVWQKLWCMQVLVTMVGLTRLNDRLGTAGVRCAFSYNGGDVLKVTNAKLNVMRCYIGSQCSDSSRDRASVH